MSNMYGQLEAAVEWASWAPGTGVALPQHQWKQHAPEIGSEAHTRSTGTAAQPSWLSSGLPEAALLPALPAPPARRTASDA